MRKIIIILDDLADQINPKKLKELKNEIWNIL